MSGLDGPSEGPPSRVATSPACWGVASALAAMLATAGQAWATSYDVMAAGQLVRPGFVELGYWNSGGCLG